MVLQLPNRAWSGDFRFPAFSAGDRAPDLGLIHTLGGRQASELIQVHDGNGDNAQRNRTAFDPDRKSARFQGVDSGLNKFLSAGHVTSFPFSLPPLAYSRLIR